MASALVVPVRASPARSWVFEKSWDRFELPKPFSPYRISVGRPYEITPERLVGETLEYERRRLEDKLRQSGAKIRSDSKPCPSMRRAGANEALQRDGAA